MIRISVRAIACAMLMLLAGAHAAEPVSPLSGQIQSMLAKPSALCGRFDQTKLLTGMKKPLLSNGRFCVVQGKGVLWRTLQPFASSLLLTRDEIVNYQGDRVAMRLSADKEPTVRTINSVLFSLLGGDLGQLDTLFDIKGNVSSSGWHVDLTARSPALAKAIGAISLDGATYVNAIRMNEASGDQTTIVFSSIHTGDAAVSADDAAMFK